MDHVVTSGSAARLRTGCTVIAVFDQNRLGVAANSLDDASKRQIRKLIKSGDVSGKAGRSLLLNAADGMKCERLLLIGCGKQADFGRRQYRRALAEAFAVIAKTGATDAANYLTMEKVKGADARTLARHGAEMAEAATYRFSQMKSEPDPAPVLQSVQCWADRADRDAAERGLKEGAAIGSGVALARDLGNLPANICTPTYLLEAARSIAKGKRRASVTVVNRDEMEKLGMGALLSVTQGSDEPPRMIVLQYKGGKKGAAPVALVGKGITFDTGGISIKPAANMDEMKYDMGGAAGVLGTMRSIVEMELPINVVCIVPSCENMPSGCATRPGDIVTSMAGKTIEVLNTDAEGRLILCDALSYSRRFKPAAVIDVATLTGACVIALGAHFSGLMSNDDKLAARLLDAGVAADDRAWQLPITEDYAEQLKSNFADLANVGGRAGGAITAAAFLSRFTEDMSWAHLDIAGTAWLGGAAKGGTGRPVGLLVQYLMDRCESAA